MVLIVQTSELCEYMVLNRACACLSTRGSIASGSTKGNARRTPAMIAPRMRASSSSDCTGRQAVTHCMGSLHGTHCADVRTVRVHGLEQGMRMLVHQGFDSIR